MTASDILILFADLQDDIIKNAKTNEEKAIRKSAHALAKIAAALNISTLATVVQLSPASPTAIDEITEVIPDLQTIPRHGPQVFAHEHTRQVIKASGKRTLAIAGVATEIVVLHAALGARAESMDVQVLLDAGAGFSERTENAAIRQMESKGVITTSLASFATSLVTDFTQPDGAAVIQALRALWS